MPNVPTTSATMAGAVHYREHGVTAEFGGGGSADTTAQHGLAAAEIPLPGRDPGFSEHPPRGRAVQPHPPVARCGRAPSVLAAVQRGHHP